MRVKQLILAQVVLLLIPALISPSGVAFTAKYNASIVTIRTGGLVSDKRPWLLPYYRDMAVTSQKNHDAYAARYGYRNHVITKQKHGDRNPAWGKIPAMIEVVEAVLNEQAASPSATEQEHWVWAFDSDAFVMNFNISLDRVIDLAKSLHA
jgi:hypothetical protein